jgi:hypothetical protein
LELHKVPTDQQQIIEILTRAHQLIADDDAFMENSGDLEFWMMAEDVREMLGKMKSRIASSETQLESQAEPAA